MLEEQRKYINKIHVDERIQYLQKLKEVILFKEDKINEALYKDLGKTDTESYMCEVGMVISEISYMLKHIKKFSKPTKVHTPLAQFKAKSYIVKNPYGLVLIMSPWNYPFLLTMEPLIDAFAAGNVACIKPSAYSKYTSFIIKEIIEEVFPKEYVSVVLGGRKENQTLLDQKFDYIFFTGSVNVGKEVMEKASGHLTPVTLELGGKSPCIVDQSANLKLAARRIVFGKFLNLGQTCVAPDYIYVHTSVKSEFLQYLVHEIQTQFQDLSQYGKIINEKHFERIKGLIDPSKVYYGGKSHDLVIEPTILDHVTWDDRVMLEEIFGPVLPILEFDDFDACMQEIKKHPTPLAFYLFTESEEQKKYMQTSMAFGGGCINDTIIHLASSVLPFGGMGNSGMGSYHGKFGFDTFTHSKSIVDKSTMMDLSIRYQPYTEKKKKLIHFFMK